MFSIGVRLNFIDPLFPQKNINFSIILKCLTLNRIKY